MKRFSLILIVFAAVMASLSGRLGAVSAETQRAAGTSEMFRAFTENAEGRYFTTTSEGITVLELIPAFGRLFASAGEYMGERSLYSYYAAELIPICQTESMECSGMASASSYDFTIRLFSNMALAGNYWPGETRQRLTLVPGGLLLSNYSGDGDALISKESILLNLSGDVPGIFPYGPAEAKRMHGYDGYSVIPESLEGSFNASWQDGDQNTSVRLSFSRDGGILLLRDQDPAYPPLLLKGGFTVSEEADGSIILCYLMSSPSSGAMPSSGCVKARLDGASLIISHPQENDDDLMLPYTAAEVVYTGDQREADGR